MTAAWHASTVHALITAGRDYLAERREDVVELVASVRELIETSARVDLVSPSVARLIGRADKIERRHAERDADTQASFDRVKRVLLDFEARIKALESASDKDAA